VDRLCRSSVLVGIAWVVLAQLLLPATARAAARRSLVLEIAAAGDSAGSWRADGRQFVFAGIASGHAVLELYDVANGKKAREVRLPQLGEAFNPSWSPDGRKIVYTALDCDWDYDRCVPGQVRIARLDGTDVIGLASGTRPAWRP